MGKFEREVKVLDINVDDTKKKLIEIGAEYLGEKNQKIYTYDLLSLYYRYLEAKELIKSNNELLVDINKKKLLIIFDELKDLVSDNDLKKIYSEINVSSFEKLLNMDTSKMIEKLDNSITFNEEISKILINPNKWIRVRKSNDKVELTVKHIYTKNNDQIQKVKEFEITVSSLEETNNILNSIGIINRNYQEKIRYSFKYKNAKIEIDIWPLLNPYLEIECDDDKVINEIVEKLNLDGKEIISVNTEELYKRKSIDILKMSNLKF